MHFFHEKLAAKIGINEAIFLQNIYYLCKNSLLKDKPEKFLDIWISLSSSTIEKYQPYFTRSITRTLTKNLIEMNLLKKCQRNSKGDKTLSYSLTDRGWILMLSLENKANLTKFKTSLGEFDQPYWLNIINLWLNTISLWSNSLEPWPILIKSEEDLANIIIEYRNIENNRIIEKKDNNKIDFEQINQLISENLVFKKSIEKNFMSIRNYFNTIIFPAMQKFGDLKVLKALKKTISESFGVFSPVFTLYANIDEL